jgi:hypothetical protein
MASAIMVLQNTKTEMMAYNQVSDRSLFSV